MVGGLDEATTKQGGKGKPHSHLLTYTQDYLKGTFTQKSVILTHLLVVFDSNTPSEVSSRVEITYVKELRSGMFLLQE